MTAKDTGSTARNELFSYLPWTIQRQIRRNCKIDDAAMPTVPPIFSSKDVAANCVRKALRRLVMVSSARQAVSGLFATGGVNAARYLGKKMSKAWSSS